MKYLSLIDCYQCHQIFILALALEKSMSQFVRLNGVGFYLKVMIIYIVADSKATLLNI